MKTINCNNSSSKSATFFANNGGLNIIAFAEQDGEYWFTIGHFKTLAGAKRSAVKQLADLGYTFNAEEMKSLSL